MLPALKRLAAEATLTLISFEKPTDDENRPVIEAIQRDLEAAGVRWIRLRYHKRPRIPATAWDVVHAWLRALLAAAARRPDIVHARGFVAGVMGRLVATTLRARFVYHNEGFYPDEQVDGGFWPAGSPMHRATKAIEDRLYDGADGLIALSHRARAVLEARPAVVLRRTPVILVPSCVDVERFRPAAHASAAPRVPRRFIYMGAVGGRYRLDDAARLVAFAARERDVRLEVLSRADPALVRKMIGDAGLPTEAWSLRAVPHAAVPSELVQHDVGLFFLSQGLSEHGCSPTKVGEYWACGLPVVTTPNVSDLEEIIARHDVGVVIRGRTDGDYREALRRLAEMLADPGLASRCHQAAREHYALEPACRRQLALYGQLARQH